MVNVDNRIFLKHSGNFIAITSGLGSMGKTWLSTTIAHALHLLHRKVLLVDADSGLLNIDFQIDISSPQYLDDVVSGKLCFNQAINPLRKGFDIIKGISGSEALSCIPEGRVQLISEDLQILSNNYDNIVVDLQPSEKLINNLLPSQTKIVLVCTNEPSNMVSTYDFLLGAKNRYNSLQLIVNYVNSYDEGLRIYDTLKKACEDYIGTTPGLLGIVRRDTRVRDAIRNHTLFLSRYPNSEAAEDVMNIAKELISGDI